MFLASLLIGLREGLEATLIVSILIAYLNKLGRAHEIRRIWQAIVVALVLTGAIGALSTFGRSRLTFKAQEIIGGSMSILAVVMITWMIFWMMGAGKKMKSTLEGEIDRALTKSAAKSAKRAPKTAAATAATAGLAVFFVTFASVAREGIETTIILWGWVDNPVALTGALAGIVLAVALGFALFKGLIHINIGRFFTYSGAALIIVAGGVLAYGIHDLQEAAVLPGPFSGLPITPVHPRTGEVLTGFFTYPFWGAAFPFGWAFDVSNVISPTGVLASFLKGTIGFVPQMSWLEVTAWFIYMFTVLPRFIRRSRANRVKRPSNVEVVAPTPSPAPTAVVGAPAHTRKATTTQVREPDLVATTSAIREEEKVPVTH